ncbi:MAG: hypothetical protein Q9195_009573 [Heterodermia aff. obscurata]
MANIPSPYMLHRDPKESKRLDLQHKFMRALCDDRLIHPCIPSNGLNAIADVGTGTGVWLEDVENDLSSLAKASSKAVYVGFDISAQQFPNEPKSGFEFVVQDIAESFPERFHGKFDLVHVRFLSYAIKTDYLSRAVENVVRILRHIASPLLREIQAVTTVHPPEKVNPINWSDQLMRLIRLETIATTNHASRLVQDEKSTVTLAALRQFLQASMTRREAKAADPLTPAAEAAELAQDVEALSKLAEAFDGGEGQQRSCWDLAMTWIVARKAIFLHRHDAWLST